MAFAAPAAAQALAAPAPPVARAGGTTVADRYHHDDFCGHTHADPNLHVTGSADPHARTDVHDDLAGRPDAHAEPHPHLHVTGNANPHAHTQRRLRPHPRPPPPQRRR